MSQPMPEDDGPQPDVVRFTPEFLKWACEQVTEEELIAGLREVQANGALGSEELLSVLDAEPPSGKSNVAVRRYSFKELMARVTPDNLRAEVSTGPPVGRETL